MFPPWLPDLLEVEPWHEDTYDELYDFFLDEFERGAQPTYEGHDVWYFPEETDGKKDIFWHLTTKEDKKTGERLPDIERAKYLSWVRPVIDHAQDKAVINFDHEEGDGTVKTYLWLKSERYIVILKKYPDGARRLITAFPIEYDHFEEKIEKKYERRLG